MVGARLSFTARGLEQRSPPLGLLTTHVGFAFYSSMVQTQDKLDKLLNKGKTAPDAVAWYKTACDPFHDYDVGINGIPDVDGQPSVVQIVPKVLSITAPPNLSANETWSVHITTLPLGQTVSSKSYVSANSSGLVAEGGDSGQLGVLGTYSVISHGDIVGTSFPNSSTPSFYNNTRQFQAVSIDDVGDNSLKKLIAGGFEVHNDTAALYKQGSVTVYQSSQHEYVAGTSSWRYLSSDIERFNSVKACRQPPRTRTEAASLPTSRTWEAAKGCYVPTRLGTSTEYKPGTFDQFRTRYFDVVDDDTNGGYMQVASTGGDDPALETYRLAHRSSSIETTGAYFSGLSPETVLTLTIKMVIESAPTPANPSLLYSASPTPDYDPRIIALYHQTIRHLPPGVEVSFNAKGDWFRMVMKAANAAAPVALPALGLLGPEATLAAEGALIAGNTAIKVMDSVKQKKKTKNSLRPPVAKANSRPNRP